MFIKLYSFDQIHCNENLFCQRAASQWLSEPSSVDKIIEFDSQVQGSIQDDRMRMKVMIVHENNGL